MPPMDNHRKLEARGLARARARSRRRRVSIIRSRTIRGSLGLFAIFWAIIFIQLVTGNDPALSRNSADQGKATATPEARASGAREPESTAAAAAPPEQEAESELEAERQLEAELAAEREGEWEPEWEAEPAPEPVVPIITSAS
jgi:hypothetical protein